MTFQTGTGVLSGLCAPICSNTHAFTSITWFSGRLGLEAAFAFHPPPFLLSVISCLQYKACLHVSSVAWLLVGTAVPHPATFVWPALPVIEHPTHWHNIPLGIDICFPFSDFTFRLPDDGPGLLCSLFPLPTPATNPHHHALCTLSLLPPSSSPSLGWFATMC